MYLCVDKLNQHCNAKPDAISGIANIILKANIVYTMKFQTKQFKQCIGVFGIFTNLPNILKLM